MMIVLMHLIARVTIPTSENGDVITVTVQDGLVFNSGLFDNIYDEYMTHCQNISDENMTNCQNISDEYMTNCHNI